MGGLSHRRRPCLRSVRAIPRGRRRPGLFQLSSSANAKARLACAPVRSCYHQSTVEPSGSFRICDIAARPRAEAKRPGRPSRSCNRRRTTPAGGHERIAGLIRRINNRFQRRFSLFVSHACSYGLRRLACPELRRAAAFPPTNLPMHARHQCFPFPKPNVTLPSFRAKRGISLRLFSSLATSYLYSSSICLIPPASSNTKSTSYASAPKYPQTASPAPSATACNFTISSTARNATIIACREGQASKN